MATRTDSSGQIVPRAQQAVADKQAIGSLRNLVLAKQKLITRAVPAHVRPERMMQVILTALGSVKYLAECEPVSFFASMLQLSQLGLEPNTPLGHAWLIPRRSKWVKERSHGKFERECGIIVGYKGYVDLFYRSGLVTSVRANVVKQGDDFEYRDGLVPILDHAWMGNTGREERPVTHAYTIVNLKEGGAIPLVMTVAQIESRRARSQSPNDGPWVTDYEAMCMKTTTRAITPWVPTSSERPHLQIAAGVDDTDKSIVQAADAEVLQMLDDAGFDVVEDVAAEAEPGKQAEEA